MKTVNEYLTNARMDSRFAYSWSHSWMVSFAQVEPLRAQMRESTRQAELLFQGLLWESFG